jgi:hypothetical protein
MINDIKKKLAAVRTGERIKSLNSILLYAPLVPRPKQWRRLGEI